MVKQINMRSIQVWNRSDTRDANFNRLHIPPKMFVDLNFTILNLTNYKHIRLNGSIPIIQPTSSLNENWTIISILPINVMI